MCFGGRIRRRCLETCLIVGVVMTAVIARAAAKEWRFDCGTAQSPVMSGYERLTADDRYTKERGYGWESDSPFSLVFGPKPTPLDGGSLGRPKLLADWLGENFNDLNSDGVASASDLVFRIDVPDGRYRLNVTIGDMSRTIGSIDVLVNDELVAEHVSAWAVGAYRFFLANPAGWWTNVRRSVRTKDGVIRITLRKNQAYYDEQMAKQLQEGSPPQKLWHELWTDIPTPYYYVGWPFVHNSIMAIEVAPDAPPPVMGKDEKLSLTRPVGSPALLEAVDAFNRADFSAALVALARVTEPDAQVAKAVIELWLAGRPEIEMEKTLVPAAVEPLRQHVAAHPEEKGLAELLEDAETFQKALAAHLGRGDPQPGVQKNHFVENGKAITQWWMIQPGSPLYYKSQVYIARAAHMLLPYIPTAGAEAAILGGLEKKFPETRFVKYLLHWQWEPYGDGSQRDDWHMVDYLARSKDAPRWAAELQARYGGLVDWAEWWIRFKQREDGSIGGGWGDDVEVGPALGYMGMISRGVSDVAVNGMRKLVQGVWDLSEVDPELGFCLPMADSGHSAEWTGNTLGLMVQLDYGNPDWIERSLKTAKLMRDLWTDYNARGRRHFRSNFFGASQVGSGDQMNDSFINYRALPPAAAVVKYNGNPAVSALITELADAWTDDAMSTERGKPRGIIPVEVSFPEGLIGGKNSPNWYTASHAPGTGNADWVGQDVKFYVHDLLLSAYSLTRNPKYLEPVRLEYELGLKYGNPTAEVPSARFGPPPWERRVWDVRDGLPLLLEDWQRKALDEALRAGRAEIGQAPPEAGAEPGSERWVGQNLKSLHIWHIAKTMLEDRQTEPRKDISREDILTFMSFYNRMHKLHWPLMTTEASATDRVHVPGLAHMFFVYTGGRRGSAGLEPAVTYENTSKHFAAAVLAHDPQGFRILYHSMAPDTREIGIVPWELDMGGTYRLRYGPDPDEDGAMDSLSGEREFVLTTRGLPVTVSVEPRRTCSIEVEQVKRGGGAVLSPDPGLSDADIRYEERYGLLLARIHNVGAKPVRHVEVAAYDGDPATGGTLIGSSLIPNIEAPNDLEPRTVTVGFNWTPSKEVHDVYVVVDPDDEIKDEITTFNNVGRAALGKQ